MGEGVGRVVLLAWHVANYMYIFKLTLGLEEQEATERVDNDGVPSHSGGQGCNCGRIVTAEHNVLVLPANTSQSCTSSNGHELLG